jgi:hypothetical protein
MYRMNLRSIEGLKYQAIAFLAFSLERGLELQMFNKNFKSVEAGSLKLGQQAQVRGFSLPGCECKKDTVLGIWLWLPKGYCIWNCFYCSTIQGR